MARAARRSQGRAREGAGGAAGASASRGTGRRRWSLSSEVWRSVTLAVTVMLVAVGVTLSLSLYVVLDHRAAQSLTQQATDLAHALDTADETPSDALSDSLLDVDPQVRVTLIASDGTVLYDNRADVASLDNHALRPEVSEALQSGEGATGRYSETVHQETLYHAVRLADGDVLRLATTQSSVVGVMAGVMPAVLAVVILGAVVAWFVGRRVSRRIARGIGSIDLDDPLRNDAPDEMEPLLERMDEQIKTLSVQGVQRRQFTANASHELKTPLTVILGYSEIIDNGIAKPEDVRRFAGLIHDEALHMKTIVNDLVTLNRLDDAADEELSLDMDERIGLAALVRKVLARCQFAADRRGIRYDVSGLSGSEAEHAVVRGNARALEDLVRNLVENAIRYNREDGLVAVRVAGTGDGGSTLEVSDTGIGIPEEYRERVFERFFCIDPSRSKETGGSGLGLAIVKHAVQLHHATIAIADNEPAGTTFTVTFPAPDASR